MATANGDGSLTREVLRAELRAGLAEQKNSIYGEIDRRLAPINDHIERMNRGEFTEAQETSIVKILTEAKDTKLYRRSLAAPLIAVGISLVSLALGVTVLLATLGVFGVGAAG